MSNLSLSFGAERRTMKRIAFLTQLLPAVAVALAASMGFQMSEPILEAVVFPEKPMIEEAVPLSLSRTETVEETAENAEEPAAVGAFADGVYQGTGTGYGGTTAVEVTVENAQIISVEVLSHHDTPSFFSRAKEPVISSILRRQTWEVDSVSGATYSSRGIKDGVKNALTGEKTVTKTPEKPKPQKLKAEKFEEPETLRDGTFTGSAKGFGGSIKVSVTIEKGEIAAIKVLSHERETPSFFEKALAIVNRILKKQSPNVDTVSGATYSSNGIREAVKNALKKAAGTPSAELDEPEEDEEEEVIIPETPVEPEKPVVGIPADGSYPVSALVDTNSASKSYLCGQFDSYTLSGNVIFEDGKLTAIDALTVGDDATDWDYEDDVMYTTYAAEHLVPALVEKQSSDVDMVSGATCSSKAIVQMYKTALGQAIDAYVEPSPEEPKQPENPEETDTPEEMEQPAEPDISEEPAAPSQEETIEEPTETEEQKETETVDESEQHEEPDPAQQPKKEEIEE